MAASTQGIRAGRAFVELFADPSKLYRVLDQAKKKFETTATALRGMGVKAGGIGMAALGPIAGFFTAAVGEGAQVDKLAQRWGLAAEKVGELQGAFAAAGVDAKDFAGIMEGLGEKIADATTANEEIIKGLSWFRGADLFGKDKEQQLEAFFDAFATIQNEADRISVAKDFGMEELIPWLKKGRAGLEELRAAQRETNSGWSSEQAKQAAVVAREFSLTMQAVKGSLLEVGKALLPTGKDFAAVGRDIRESLAKAREWITNNRQVVVAVTAVAAAFVAAGIALVGFSVICSTVAPILAALAVAVKLTVAAFTLLASPVGLVAVGVTAVAAGFLYLLSLTDEGQAKFAEMRAAFGELVDWVKSGWKGISDALSVGDWSLAFRISIAMAREAWAAFVYGLTIVWNDFKGAFVDGWEEVTTWLAKTLTNVGAFIMRNTLGALKKLIDGYNSIAGAIDDSLKVNVGGLMSDEDINAARDGILKEIDADHARGQKARKDARDKDEINAMNEWNEAAAELKRLKEEAAKKVEEAANPKAAGPAAAPAPRKKEEALPTPGWLAANVKGLFSGAAAQQQLGYGDNLGQRQLDAAVNTADNTAKTAAGVATLGDRMDKLATTMTYTT